MAYPPEQLAPRQTSKQPLKQAFKPAVKPAAKLVAQRPVAKKPRHPVSQPVDADDLRRRLFIVISQRDAATEKKRQARVDAAAAAAAKKAKEAEEKTAAAQQEEGNTTRAGELKPISEEDKENLQRSHSSRRTEKTQQEQARTNGQNAPYVPQQAALQFARTATAQNMQDSSRVHELSRPALRVHTGTLAFDKTVLNTSAAGQTRAIRRVQSERQKLRERNQFQTSRILEGSADVELTQKSQKRYTIPNSDLTGGIMTSKRFSVRRSLDCCDERDVMGFLKSSEVTSATSPVVNPSDHRMVDWSQSDEPQEKKRGARSPLLRRADSLWALKDRLSKYGQDKETTVDVDLSEKVDTAVPKPVKRGFWTKVIKRHAATVQA